MKFPGELTIIADTTRLQRQLSAIAKHTEALAIELKEIGESISCPDCGSEDHECAKLYGDDSRLYEASYICSKCGVSFQVEGMRTHTVAAKGFYKSSAWQKCRQSYIYSVHGLCEHCEGPGYIVDHIIEINIENVNDPDITLNHDNLQYLCTPCHNKKTFTKYSPIREGFGFDDQGNLIQIKK